MTTPKFELLNFSKEKLLQSYSSDVCSVRDIGEMEPAAYIGRYLVDLKAQTIIVEHGYVDGDYLEDFASYYVRCFYSYDRRCKRLHFFSESFDNSEFNNLVLGSLASDRADVITRSYLGFSVARPLPNAVVGRTLIATYPDDGGRRNYTVVQKYEANLFGIPLTIQTLPFQEQDTVLAACATVALWSALHKTKGLFGTAAPRPAEITRIANDAQAPLGRAFPSHGLTLNQMIHAVRKCGLEPEVFGISEALPILSIIYAHLRWGIPVVLGANIGSEGHAVTLTGFSLSDKRTVRSEVAPGQSSVPYRSLRINEFYAHDDQIGPFSRLKVKETSRANPIVFEGDWKDGGAGRLIEIVPTFLLVPVYNKIRVTCQDVHAKIAALWEVLLVVLVSDPTDYEWDLHLTTTNELKRTLSLDPTARPKKAELLFKQHPKYIWSASLSHGKCKLFEILADATDMERSLPFYEMIFLDEEFRKRLESVLASAKLQPHLEKWLTVRFFEFLCLQTRGEQGE